MKQIDNYISEKLHIGKGYRADLKDSFKEFLEKYGCDLDKVTPPEEGEDNGWEVIASDSEDGFPCFDIELHDDYWIGVDPESNMDNRKLTIFDTNQNVQTYIAKDLEVNDNGYTYSEKNAKLLAEEILKSMK